MEKIQYAKETVANSIIEDFVRQLLIEAEFRGLSYLEISISEKEGLVLSVGQGELSGMTAYNEQVASLRGISDGKLGTTYTEQVHTEYAASLINALLASAELGGDNDCINMSNYGGKKIFEPEYFGRIEKGVAEKIERLLSLEAAALNVTSEIQKTDFCEYQEFNERRYWFNSTGIDLRDSKKVCTAAVSAVAIRGDIVRTAFAAETATHSSELSFKQLGEEAGVLATKSLGGSSIPSGTYPVILVNTVAAALLEGFASVFCADRVLDKLSLLEGKVGRSIASPLISILDDPQLTGGYRFMNFDDEGTLTSRLNIVTDGILNGYLHNNKTARHFDQPSTGHGIRSSHKSNIEVQPSNLWIEKGKDSLDMLLRQMENGLLITDVQGTFAGINAISGEFSLQASGFSVEEGKVTSGVNGITISGNYFDMLLEVAGVADDLRFGMPYGAYVGSPSLFVPVLTVAGE